MLLWKVVGIYALSLFGVYVNREAAMSTEIWVAICGGGLLFNAILFYILCINSGRISRDEEARE